jgi:hypothetical protein
MDLLQMPKKVREGDRFAEEELFQYFHVRFSLVGRED